MIAVFTGWLAQVIWTVTLLQPPTPPSTGPTPHKAGSPPPSSRPANTDAERIGRARDAVQRGEKVLVTLQKRLDDPVGEYPKSQAEFQDLDRKLTETRLAIIRSRKEGSNDEAAKLEATLPMLEEERGLARERFDLAIRQRKLTHEAIAGLKTRIAKDQMLLDQLEGKAPAPSPAAGVATQPTASVPTADHHAPVPGEPVNPDPVDPSAAKPNAVSLAPPPGDTDPVVHRAKETLAERKAEQREAELRARTAEDRVKALERSAKTAAQMLQLEQESAAQAEKAVARLTESIATNPPSDLAEQQVIADRLADARDRLASARERVKRISDRTLSTEETLKELREDVATATREAEAAAAATAEAEAALDELLSPLAPRNLAHWLTKHGPNLLCIVIGMVVLHLISRQFSKHIVQLVARENHRGSVEDRENRGHTLVGVFRYVAGVGVFGGGAAMLLDEVGVPIVPLVGGAAVLGLAVAFGAQNLIRDYFTGFMMLMEDQYSVNDVVRIGSVSGLVEQITLRVTVLRDLEGVRHVIPHGTVTSVSNLTHGWSRALFDIPVSYKENVDQVIAVLIELGRAMRTDPALGKYVLEDPEMLGVDSFGDTGAVVKFFLKTKPLKQWPIKRELLRRIKNRFDELGIEIPVPQRTVNHRFPDGMPSNQDYPNGVMKMSG